MTSVLKSDYTNPIYLQILTNRFIKQCKYWKSNKINKHKLSLYELLCLRILFAYCSNSRYCPFSEASLQIQFLANTPPTNRIEGYIDIHWNKPALNDVCALYCRKYRVHFTGKVHCI